MGFARQPEGGRGKGYRGTVEEVISSSACVNDGGLRNSANHWRRRGCMKDTSVETGLDS